MKYMERTNKTDEFKHSLGFTIGQIESRFRSWYAETEIVDEVAEGIVLDSYSHGAIDNNLKLLIPKKVLDDVMRSITPTDDELSEAERYIALKNNFDNLFDNSDGSQTVNGFTREMHSTWRDNITKLVVHGMEKVVSPVTDRETDNGIDFTEATREVFIKLIALEQPILNHGMISIENEVSKNLGNSTSPEIFLSVLNWMKNSPGLGFQWYLHGGIFSVRDRLLNSVAGQLGIDKDDMNTMIFKVEQNPEILIQVAPLIGHVITTYTTHGAKNAMLYLLELGELAQQDIAGTMELPMNLQRQDFYKYLADKIIRYATSQIANDVENSPLEVVFEKFPRLKDAYTQRISSVASQDLLIENGCVLPGYIYGLIFKNPTVITKLIPCLERTFGHGDGRVAISMLYMADLGQKAKLQRKMEE